MRKLFLVTIVALLIAQTTCFAAVSGAKSQPRPASPPPLPSTTQSAPASTPASGYKPSAPASSYSDKAPSVQPAAAAAASAQQSTGGGFMRNLGMLGGGMILGSMLGSMFGMGGGGMLSSLLGIIITIIPFVLIFMAGRFLWDRMRKSQTK